MEPSLWSSFGQMTAAMDVRAAESDGDPASRPWPCSSSHLPPVLAFSPTRPTRRTHPRIRPSSVTDRFAYPTRSAVAREGFASTRRGNPQAVSSAPDPQPEAAASPQRESQRDRAGRYTRRTWLYTWATLLIIALIAIVILVAENTRRVKVGWIFGHSHISLVFLVLFAAILGWLLGISTSVVFRRRTRHPH